MCLHSLRASNISATIYQTNCKCFQDVFWFFVNNHLCMLFCMWGRCMLLSYLCSVIDINISGNNNPPDGKISWRLVRRELEEIYGYSVQRTKQRLFLFMLLERWSSVYATMKYLLLYTLTLLWPDLCCVGFTFYLLCDFIVL